ncbi:hypothetical protein [Actinoplanes sp. M2I2]|uniref:hypothetical protein n=1 Tax=Actinoplanes sp. M2I2 TaxID=1734444 RepID=UPI0020221998|nr:hypothetical protein [Actinoplanes sp. M2I2]
MTDTATPLRRPMYAAGVATAAAALGLLAFAADFVDGAGGRVLIALTSSGFAWGLAAILAGRSADTARLAAVGAAALLIGATTLYYLLIAVVSRRWSGGYLQDGSSAGLSGLRSVAVMAAVWLAGSILGGPLLGLLGHAIRAASVRVAALAAGVGCGLLSAEGWYAATWTPPGSPLTFDVPSFSPFALGQNIQIVLPLAVLAWLTVVHRLGRAWPSLLGATAVTAATGALLWHVLEVVELRLA